MSDGRQRVERSRELPREATVDPEDLNPMAPDEAVDLYLEERRDDAADWTLTSHEIRFRPFLEWCEVEEIENLNYLDGRDLYRYRVWRREGGYSDGTVDNLAPKTLNTTLHTLSRFLQFAGNIEAVPEALYLKVPIPDLDASDEVSDSKIVPERVPPILDYLEQYHYARRNQIMVLLMWTTGARIGGLRALDLRDLDLDGHKPHVEYVNRPESDTRLKNGEKSERVNRISRRVADTLQDYIDGPRVDNFDEYGRAALLSTKYGRAAPSTIRNTLYKVTRPCWIGEPCPHEKDPDTCDWTYYDQASKCPSSRSPHDVRKARVTQYRNDGVHRGIVSDELDASEDVLDKHYDRATKHERAERRWRQIHK